MSQDTNSRHSELVEIAKSHGWNPEQPLNEFLEHSLQGLAHCRQALAELVNAVSRNPNLVGSTPDGAVVLAGAACLPKGVSASINMDIYETPLNQKVVSCQIQIDPDSIRKLKAEQVDELEKQAAERPARPLIVTPGGKA